MRKIKMLTFMSLTFLIVSLFLVSYKASGYSTPAPEQLNVEPNYYLMKTTWYGGPISGEALRIEGKTLDEISVSAFREAVFSGGPVKYKSEDGGIAYWAYPVFGKSRCERVYEKAWQEGKLILDKSKKVCLINQEK